MDINLNSQGAIRKTQVFQAGGYNLRSAEGLRKPVDSDADVVELSEKYADEKGKIQLIVSSSRKDTLQKAEKAFARKENVVIKDKLPLINGFVAEVDASSLKELLTIKPDTVNIFIDEKYKMIEDPIFTPQPEASVMTDNAVKTLGVDKLWEKGITGKGVTIAIIDTGIYPHKDFEGRIIGFKDFVNGYKEPYDDQGHGTHVAGDCAGDGTMSGGKYMGTAPEANLVGIKSLDKHGAGRFSDIIKGIQWAVKNKEKYNIKVINMSLGGPAFASYKEDPICQAIEKAIDAGIIPVVAAGNSGPKASTIGSPGSDPKVLTVGAFDDKNTEATYDDEIAKFSSRGPTIDNLTKPDILSPGVNITAATAYGSVLDTHPKIPHAGKDYITISGTSMATPIMAGIVALAVHVKPDITTEEVKDVFTSTAQRLPGLDANQQGYGVVRPVKAILKILKPEEQ